MAGIAYAALNVGLLITTISLDAFAIFEIAYIVSVGLIGPALMVVALVWVTRTYQRLGPLGISGFVAWIGSVGLAHLFAIAAASASV